MSDVSGSFKTSELFSRMTAITGIPPSDMRLLLGQKKLKPNKTLRNSGIVNGCSINLSVIGHGGGKGMHIIMLNVVFRV